MIIKKAEYLISAVAPEQYPQLGYPEYVFMGRSNVGKSSFINAIVGRKNLAYTSSQPGKTITLNFYNINDQILFVDVPGYGYAKTMVTERLKYGGMIDGYLENNKHLIGCFLIVDLRHEPTEDDVLMYQYLTYHHYKVFVIATKADKIGKTLIYRHLKVVSNKLGLKNDDVLLAVSSETKEGIAEVIKLIEETYEV